jgi:hypothetical protein
LHVTASELNLRRPEVLTARADGRQIIAGNVRQLVARMLTSRTLTATLLNEGARAIAPVWART